jgi:phage shock protein A
MNIKQVKEDVASLEAKLVTLAEDHNKIQDEMKQLEAQFNELRAKRDSIAIEFGQENAVLVKLKGYLPEDETAFE